MQLDGRRECHPRQTSLAISSPLGPTIGDATVGTTRPSQDGTSTGPNPPEGSADAKNDANDAIGRWTGWYPGAGSAHRHDSMLSALTPDPPAEAPLSRVANAESPATAETRP